MLYFVPSSAVPSLLDVDVEDVLAAAVRVRVVLHGANGPLGLSGHGVLGDAAEKADLLGSGVDAVDEGVEVGRVVEGVELGLEGALVGGVLVVVDGVPHLPEIAAEFLLLGAFDLEAGRWWDSCSGEDADDGDHDDEFDKGKTGLAA